MSNVWDRTTDVLRGRGGQLATIGLLTLFLPNLVGAAVNALAPGGEIGVTLPVTMLVGAVGVFGGLAIVATATDPELDTAGAIARAAQRFGPAIGTTILIALAFGVALLPMIALIGLSGVNLTALRTGTPDVVGAVSRPGMLALALLYLLVLTGVGVWASARLAVLRGVIVNERLGIGAIARTWSLTRGLALRIVGVMLLFGIVVGVAFTAVVAVVGLAARFLVGADAVALPVFLSSAAGAVVTTAFTVVVGTFLGQLYVAITRRGVATVFE